MQLKLLLYFIISQDKNIQSGHTTLLQGWDFVIIYNYVTQIKRTDINIQGSIGDVEWCYKHHQQHFARACVCVCVLSGIKCLQNINFSGE